MLEEDGVLQVDAVVMGIAGTVVATVTATVVESDIVSPDTGVLVLSTTIKQQYKQTLCLNI